MQCYLNFEHVQMLRGTCIQQAISVYSVPYRLLCGAEYSPMRDIEKSNVS